MRKNDYTLIEIDKEYDKNGKLKPVFGLLRSENETKPSIFGVLCKAATIIWTMFFVAGLLVRIHTIIEMNMSNILAAL